jgi:hypothetical protein
MRMGVDAQDRLRSRLGYFLDLDAALRRRHHEDRARRAVQDRAEVELAHDVGGGCHKDLAHLDALDRHAEDPRGHVRGLVRGCGELHAACLAAAAHEDLCLDHHLLRTGGQEVGCGSSDFVGRRCDAPRRHGQSRGREQRLGVELLQLHAGLPTRAASARTSSAKLSTSMGFAM